MGTAVTNAPNFDLSYSVGSTACMAVADLDPAVSSRVGAVEGFSEDQMSLKFLGMRWNLVGGSDASGEFLTGTTQDIIMTVPVCPGTIDDGLVGATNYVYQAPMVLGQFCTYWRGVCRVKVMVFAGSLDGGRLIVFWHGASRPATPPLKNTQFPSCIIDVGAGQRECQFDVPWSVAETMLALPNTYASMP